MLRVLIALACIGLLGWMALAIIFSPLEPSWLRVGLASLGPVVAIVALFLLRPLWRVAALVVVAFVVVLGAWLAIPASNDRDWQPEVATLPYADIRGDRMTVHNVRNADYRSETDFTIRLEDRELDLSEIRSLDLFLVYWGSPAIAHTIMSWGFEGDKYLAISIETRKEKGESYSALRGFFRQYELTYVVADERDVVRLRSNHRGEDVYVYRFDVSPEGARQLLLSYFDAINQLRERPEWYNAMTHNCTTTIQQLAAHYERRSWWSWKLLLNGYFDELGYENGAFDNSLSFPELKALSHINERAQAADRDPRFSIRIRQGVPRMTEAPGT
jgi:hypothetical protein